ncbi:MAG TPA: aldo/keto reductase [Bryobacteraceae bacterium]|nr:aldo/keto reductase [Bryobacteraceae bacterium]
MPLPTGLSTTGVNSTKLGSLYLNQLGMDKPDASTSGTFTLGGDLTLNRLGFGAMRITGSGIWGEPADVEGAKKVLRRAVELGVNFIDTADSYGPEVSERLIAEALHPYPKELVIATKGGLTRQGPNKWAPVGRPEYLQQCVEMSLRRLRVERIDLYQLHRIDPKVPAEESLGILRDLQKAGKIRHVGLSEVSPAEIERAKKTVAVISVQNQYNLGDRRHEDVVTYCEKNGLGFIPWFPVAAGKLTSVGGPLEKAAKSNNATMAQLALAWLLHRSPVILPIPGTSSTAHLEENIRAGEIRLDENEWKALEQSAQSAKA